MPASRSAAHPPSQTVARPSRAGRPSRRRPVGAPTRRPTGAARHAQARSGFGSRGERVESRCGPSCWPRPPARRLPATSTTPRSRGSGPGQGASCASQPTGRTGTRLTRRASRGRRGSAAGRRMPARALQPGCATRDRAGSHAPSRVPARPAAGRRRAAAETAPAARSVDLQAQEGPHTSCSW